jgi:hypothetical protein
LAWPGLNSLMMNRDPFGIRPGKIVHIPAPVTK